MAQIAIPGAGACSDALVCVAGAAVHQAVPAEHSRPWQCWQWAHAGPAIPQVKDMHGSLTLGSAMLCMPCSQPTPAYTCTTTECMHSNQPHILTAQLRHAQRPYLWLCDGYLSMVLAWFCLMLLVRASQSNNQCCSSFTSSLLQRVQMRLLYRLSWLVCSLTGSSHWCMAQPQSEQCSLLYLGCILAQSDMQVLSSVYCYICLLHLPSYEAGVASGWPSRPALKPCSMPCMQIPRVAASSGFVCSCSHPFPHITHSVKQSHQCAWTCLQLAPRDCIQTTDAAHCLYQSHTAGTCAVYI
jgi:hypothetical protein